MGMYQPDTRIVCAKPENYEPVRLDLNSVPSQGVFHEGEIH